MHDANIVVTFERAPQIDFGLPYERAAGIKSRLNLPAKGWGTGLKSWMMDHQD